MGAGRGDWEGGVTGCFWFVVANATLVQAPQAPPGRTHHHRSLWPARRSATRPLRLCLVRSSSSSSSSSRFVGGRFSLTLALACADARSGKFLPAALVILRLCLGLSSSSSSSRSLGDCFALTLALACADARSGKSLPTAPAILRLCLGLSSSSSSSRFLGGRRCASTLALACAVARTGNSLPVAISAGLSTRVLPASNMTSRLTGPAAVMVSRNGLFSSTILRLVGWQ